MHFVQLASNKTSISSTYRAYQKSRAFRRLKNPDALSSSLCTFQLREIRSSLNLHRDFTSSSIAVNANEKFERAAHIPESIRLGLRIGRYRRSGVNNHFHHLATSDARDIFAPKRKVALTSFVGRDALPQPRSLHEFIVGDTHDDSGMISAYCEIRRRFSCELPRSSVISRMNQTIHGYFYDGRWAPPCCSLIDSQVRYV